MQVDESERLINRILDCRDPVMLMDEVIARLHQEPILRAEFYRINQDNVKAEFIAGEIVFHSPVRARHWEVSQAKSSHL